MYKIKAGEQQQGLTPVVTTWLFLATDPCQVTPFFHYGRREASGALGFMSCSVHVCQVVACLVGCLWRITRSQAEQPGELKTMDREVAQRMLWKMEIPMALELVSTKCLCLPLRAPLRSPQTSRDSRPRIGCFTFCQHSWYVYFVLTFWCKRNHRNINQCPARHHPTSFFSSLPLYWLPTLCTSNPQARKAGCYLFSCPWVLNSWLLRTWEQGVRKRTDELSCVSEKGEEAQQECWDLRKEKNDLFHTPEFILRSVS